MRSPPCILVVDSHGEAGELVQFLERNGYACVQARGPLRVRSLLEARGIDAIVFKDHPGPDDLQKDYFREYDRFPDVPVVSLGAGANPPPSPRANVVAIALHAYPAELCPGLRRVMDAAQPAQFSAPKSELAFRNVFHRLRTRPQTPSEAPADLQARQALKATATSVNPGERAELFPAATRPTRQAGGAARALVRRWLKD